MKLLPCLHKEAHLLFHIQGNWWKGKPSRSQMKIIENPDKVFWSQGKGASQQDRNGHSKRPFQPTRMARIKKTDNTKCWWGCGEIGSLIHCWWDYKMINHFGKSSLWQILIKQFTYDLVTLLLAIPNIPKTNNNICPCKNMCIFIEA